MRNLAPAQWREAREESERTQGRDQAEARGERVVVERASERANAAGSAVAVGAVGERANES